MNSVRGAFILTGVGDCTRKRELVFTVCVFLMEAQNLGMHDPFAKIMRALLTIVAK